LVLAEQNSIHAAKNGIESINYYCLQVAAIAEHAHPDTGDTAGNQDVGQTGASGKCKIPYDAAYATSRFTLECAYGNAVGNQSALFQLK
jgi:hypothetical protein